MQNPILCETLYQDASLAHRVRFYGLPNEEILLEYLLLDSRGQVMHTFVLSRYESLSSAVDALAFEEKVMPWLYQKVMDDLENGEKG